MCGGSKQTERSPDSPQNAPLSHSTRCHKQVKRVVLTTHTHTHTRTQHACTTRTQRKQCLQMVRVSTVYRTGQTHTHTHTHALCREPPTHTVFIRTYVLCVCECTASVNLIANIKADFPKRIAYITTHNRTVNTSGKP